MGDEIVYGMDIPDDIDSVSFLIDDDGYLTMMDSESGEIVERFRIH